MENQRLLKIRVTVGTLEVNPDEIEGLPNPLSKESHVQALLRGYGHKIAADLFLRGGQVLLVNQVHLVQDDQSASVYSVTSQDVGQPIVSAVVSHQNAAITDSVLLNYSLYSCRGELGKFDARGQRKATLVAPSDDHVGGLLVDPNAHLMKLMLQQLYLTRLKHVQDQQDQVRVSRHRQNSSPSATSRRSTADDSWQVKNLNISTIVPEYSRDHRQSSESVGCHLRPGVRQPIQNRRLAHAGKTNQNYGRVASLLDLESRSSALGSGALELSSKPGELGLQQPNMMLSMLVDLGLTHLPLDLLNLLRKTHHESPRSTLIKVQGLL